MTPVCTSVCIRDGNPIYGCGVEITTDINPINVGLERSFPRDSKNVSYLFRLDFVLWVGWGGLSKNLVKPWA